MRGFQCLKYKSNKVFPCVILESWKVILHNFSTNFVQTILKKKKNVLCQVGWPNVSSNFHPCPVNITIKHDQLMSTTVIKDVMTHTMERTTAHINAILSTINFVCLPWRARAICCHTNMGFLVIKELFVEGCGVMSWQPPQACCRVCVCVGMQRVEGLRLGAAGAKRGTGGGGEGNIPSNWKRVPH